MSVEQPSINAQIQQLEEQKDDPNLSVDQRAKIEDQLRKLKPPSNENDDNEERPSVTEDDSDFDCIGCGS